MADGGHAPSTTYITHNKTAATDSDERGQRAANAISALNCGKSCHRLTDSDFLVLAGCPPALTDSRPPPPLVLAPRYSQDAQGELTAAAEQRWSGEFCDRDGGSSQ